MSNVAYYAIHYGVDEKGYIAFNKDNKEMTVVLPDETWQKKGLGLFAYATDS